MARPSRQKSQFLVKSTLQALRFPLHAESGIPEATTLKDRLGELGVRVVEGHLEVELPSKGYRYLQWKAD
jgi:hypothetical protein